MILQVGGFRGCYPDNHRNNWRCARAVRKRPQGHTNAGYCRVVFIGAFQRGACLLRTVPISSLLGVVVDRSFQGRTRAGSPHWRLAFGH